MNQKELRKIMPPYMDYHQLKYGPYKGWYVSTDGKINNENPLTWNNDKLINSDVYGPFTYKEMINFILDVAFG